MEEAAEEAEGIGTRGVVSVVHMRGCIENEKGRMNWISPFLLLGVLRSNSLLTAYPMLTQKN